MSESSIPTETIYRERVASGWAAFFALKGPARDRLRSRLERLSTDRPTLAALKRRDARWLAPEVTVIVRHLSGSGIVRHATVKEVVG